YGGINALRELESPVNIIGFDDTVPSKYLGLTTIRQPAYQLGLEGARQIMSLIISGDNKVLSKCIQPELIVRST
ncbi:MAG TPA: LacI family transcriptional regulator, partial [Firmicutes bacterium]|nr:LacI family transcriptional regulator [Bacillota bacterium]